MVIHGVTIIWIYKNILVSRAKIPHVIHLFLLAIEKGPIATFLTLVGAHLAPLLL